MVDVTVAIPTYNGASRLPEVLDRLRSQTGTEQISWEVIVIDNNSTDNTAKLVQDYQTNWVEGISFRYCFEPEQGLAFARQRAVKEANGTFIGFLDDDNWPAPNWVASACAFGKEHLNAGAYSGKIHGNFEVNPPKNFERIQRCLAIGEHGLEPHQFDPENLRLPPGAGLVVRKQAWSECVPPRPILRGRVGGSMLGGEDYEPLLYMHKAGWEIWYNPAMYIDHRIPHWRFEKDYLLSLARCCGLPICQLRMINAKNWQKPPIFMRTLLGNLRRVVMHLIKYQGQIKTDVIAAFELEFFIGSALSPFYYLKSKI